MKQLRLCALMLAVAILFGTVLLLASCSGEEKPSGETAASSDTTLDTLPGTTPDTIPDTAPDTVLGTESETLSAVETAPETTPETALETAAPDTVPETAEETAVPETDYFDATKIELVKPDTTKVPDMAVTDKGYDIYQLTKGREWGYRYGCTYLYNDDGSVDAYFACVGQNTGEWDWIAYQHSPDGGVTWEDEKIVLTPTQGSMDFYSNCDPGVVYFNGYYYLGYTSTLNSIGTCNNLFVARSENPDGPFEKWNGSGWGGYEPQPIVYYDENYEQWGIGEPSFVELNGTLYMYYTHTGAAGDYTMVATADATDENWPATLQFRGAACRKNTDSIDVKYVEEWGKFIGIGTGDRMGPSSWLGVYESNDGIHFELKDITREGTYSHLHNAGISSRPNGHIKLTEDAAKLRVIYAYGEGWGTWNTRVQPISLKLSSGNDMAAERYKSCLADEHLRAEFIPVDERHIAMIRPMKDVYYYTATQKGFVIQLNAFDTYFDKIPMRGPDFQEPLFFTDYDESVVTIDNDSRRATIVGAGTTPVLVHYGDLCYLFHIVITEEAINTGDGKTPVKLEPVFDSYTLYLGERSTHRLQLRVRQWMDDGSFTEYFVDKSDKVITYTGYDESILTVTDKGIVTVKKAGVTTVTVTVDGMSVDIQVKVTNDPADGYYKLAESAQIIYHDLDFTEAGDEKVFSGLHSTQLDYDANEGALKAVVTGGDPIISIPFSNAPDVYSADEYHKIEITYRVDPENSAAASRLQVFLCSGTVTEPNAAYQVMNALNCDGEYHTLTIDLSALSYWTGDIHMIRIDYFDQASAGDTMYIKSIKLLK